MGKIKHLKELDDSTILTGEPLINVSEAAKLKAKIREKAQFYG